MAKNHSNQGGGYDGGDPDAEIKRLAAEEEARQAREREDRARRDRQRRDREGN